MRPIGAELGTLADLPGVEIRLAEPDVEALLDPRRYPPRERVEANLASVTLRLEGLRRGNQATWVERLEAEQRHLERQLHGCDLRDRIQATRPAGCWCLGRGWRVSLPHERDAARILYCACPAGVEAERVHVSALDRQMADMAAMRIERVWKRAGLDLVARDFSTASWAAEVARRSPHYKSWVVVDGFERWLDTSEWLFLEGPYGTGKTVFMALACRELALRGHSVIWESAPELFAKLRATFHHSEDRSPNEDELASERSLMDMLTAVDVLALDDLDKVRTTAWVQETFYRLVNARYQGRGRLLVTSNRAPEDPTLGERVGEAALHRIAQRCGDGGLFRLGGPNLRLDPEAQ